MTCVNNSIQHNFLDGPSCSSSTINSSGSGSLSSSVYCKFNTGANFSTKSKHQNVNSIKSSLPIKCSPKAKRVLSVKKVPCTTFSDSITLEINQFIPLEFMDKDKNLYFADDVIYVPPVRQKLVSNNRASFKFKPTKSKFQPELFTKHRYSAFCIVPSPLNKSELKNNVNNSINNSIIHTINNKIKCMPTRSSTTRQDNNNNNNCFKHKMENVNGLRKNKLPLEHTNELPLICNNNNNKDIINNNLHQNHNNIGKKLKSSSSTTVTTSASQAHKTMSSQMPINTNISLTKRYFLRSSTNKQQQNLLEIQENGKIIKNNIKSVKKPGKKRASTTSSTINTRRVRRVVIKIFKKLFNLN